MQCMWFVIFGSTESGSYSTAKVELKPVTKMHVENIINGEAM